MAFRNLVIPRPSTLNPRVDRADPALTYPLKSNRTASQTAQPSPPTRESDPQFNIPIASTRRVPPPTPPVKRTRCRTLPPRPPPASYLQNAQPPPPNANSALAASSLEATGLGTTLRQSNISNQLTCIDSSEALDGLKKGPARLRDIALRTKKLTLWRRQWRPTHCRRSLW
jgi:hypothetical protein